MRSSEKIRLLVFSAFLVALITFAILYSPVSASSLPAHQGNSAAMPVGEPLQIKVPPGFPPQSGFKDVHPASIDVGGRKARGTRPR